MWDLSSPTRDKTLTPCSGSVEYKPLDHQGSPFVTFQERERDLLYLSELLCKKLEDGPGLIPEKA